MSEPLPRLPQVVGRALIAALGLAALADFLFFQSARFGVNVGAFAFAWLGAVMLLTPVLRRRRSAAAALIAAAFAVLLVEDPNPLAWTLFWLAIASAVVLTLHRFDDALRWSCRLALYVGYGLLGPAPERQRLAAVVWPGIPWRAIFPVVALPLIGGVLFLSLFAAANPIIGAAIAAIHLPDLATTLLHALLWLVAFMAVWPSLRPHEQLAATEITAVSLGEMWTPPVLAIGASLICFNILFTLQNALDILFLWSSAPLPAGVTLADYAHRGAYLLIATALLAGLFVLVVLKPGSEAARQPGIRGLVALWVAQNMLLVASSMLRTIDYVQAYSLTELRIWALGWMMLVGVGLGLICWRLLFNRSGAWLINMNAAAAALALTAAAASDTAGVVAQWNVRHAREAGGAGAAIDLCYLDALGPAALLPLIELEGRVRDPALLDRVRAVRDAMLGALQERQANWRSWTFRNARRLSQARTALGVNPAHATPAPGGRECGEPIAEAPKPVNAPPAAPAADDNAAGR